MSLNKRNLTAVAALLLAACASSPEPAPLEAIEKPIAVRVLWQASVGNAGTAVFEPAVVGGDVLTAAENGTVVRLDAATGNERWRVTIPARLSGGVAATERLIVVGSYEGDVFTLDEEGRVLWRARVTSEVLTAPVIADDVVVVRSADSRVFAFDARDGRRRWLYQRAAPSLSVRAPTGIVVRGGHVFAGFAGGKLVALAMNNGGLRWEGTVALPRGTTELERIADVIGLPWVSERQTCAVAFQGRVACFDLGNGQPMWSRDMSSSSGLGADGRYVYVSEAAGALAALDRTTGASLWRQDKLGNRRLSAPLPLGGEIAVGDLEGYVHFVARDNGAFVGRIATDGSPISSTPVLLANGFLVQTSAGNLYALSVR